MKQISTQQIEAIMQACYQSNMGIQAYEGIKNLLLGLPEIKE